MIPDAVPQIIPHLLPELGHLALVIAFAFAICLSIIPLVGVHSSQSKLMSYARPLTFGMFVFTGISICILAYSFVLDDFSVKYIASGTVSVPKIIDSHLPTLSVYPNIIK